MPDPETSWLDEAEDVTDAPEWTSEALEVKETVPKEIGAAERARSGLPVFGGDTDPSAPREELTEDFVARDRVEGGRARGRVLELAPTDISVDPRTGDSAISVPDASEAREAVLYEPSEDVIARTPGISRARDDSVSLRGGARFEGLPGLASALQYAEGLVPDARYSPGAMATGASEMLTLGHTDEIAGGIRGAQGPGTYEEERDRARAEMAERAAEQPGSTLMGMGAGLGLMALVPGAREAAAARGGGAAARIGAAVGEGTVLGAAAGSGASEAEFGSPEHLRDTSTGGVIGGAASGAMQGTGEAVGAVGRRVFSDVADDAARARLAASGIRYEQDARNAARVGNVEMAGRLREGNIGGRFPTPARAQEDSHQMLERASAALEDVTRRMDEAASAAPAAGYREASGATAGQVDLRPLRETLSRIEAEAASTPGASPIANAARALREEYEAIGDSVSFSAAHRIRRFLDNQINWNRDNTAPLVGFKQQIRGALRDQMNEAAERVSPELRAQWEAANRDYQTGRIVFDAAERVVDRSSRYVNPNLRQTIAGTEAFFSSDSPLEGIGRAGLTAAAVSQGTQRLPGVRARGLEAIQRIVERSPGQLGPYGTMLQNALNRGPGTFSAAWYLLARQHPELQQRVQDIDAPDSAPSGAGEY